jgi:hypothetical protein
MPEAVLLAACLGAKKLTKSAALRAIDFHEGERINASALKTLVRDAVALNKSKAMR